MKTANLHQLDWDDIRHFLEVVRSGSVTRAAERLGCNQSTVSRRIAALERRLSTNLFDRGNGSGWAITPTGERLSATAEQMAEQADTLQRQIISDATEIRGPVRLTLGDCSLQDLVMPAIKQFLEEYPGVNLELIATDEVLNLANREADVALRLTDEPPANVVGKRIATIRYQVYGTLRWLEEFQVGQRDLPCITWLGDGQTLPPWIRKNFPDTKRVYRVNNAALALGMARHGIGLVQIPCMMGDLTRGIHRIPVDYVEEGWGLWVLSHVDLRTTARVRMFRDCLVKELESRRDLLEGNLVSRSKVA